MKGDIMRYKVKFEFYGRKMQTEAIADSEEQAKEKVMRKLKFVSVKAIGKPSFDFFTELNKIRSNNEKI
jgi:hypothetical protein